MEGPVTEFQAMYRYLIVSALLLSLPLTAWADITGQPRVIDGDTLEIDGQRIRLHGIDAPEIRQPCYRDSKPWRCGEAATKALAGKIGRHAVRCEERGRGRYGRTVAVCYAGGEDLGAWMVAQGLALAYRRYSMDYVDQEAEARAARRGIWGTTFEKPWEWRKRQRGRPSGNP